MSIIGSYANGFAPRDGQPLYPELWRGCVGAWAPCLGPTGLTLRDWSGFGNQGTLTSMDPGTDWVVSQGRYALDFDGSNDYITMGSPAALQLRNDVSVDAWVYPRSTNQLVIGAHANGASAFFILMFSFGSNSKFSFWNTAGGPTVTAPSTSTLNTWHHVGAKRTSSGVELFVNGVSVGTAAGATGDAVGTCEMTLGRFGNFSGYYSSSLISHAAVWSRGLSGSEFTTLARRPGIMHEMAPRRRSGVSGGFQAAWAARRSLIIGGGLN